jgi:hypothetical protein
MQLPNPLKPYYVYRPSQLIRRIMRFLFPPAEPIQIVTLPWGCPIEIDIREVIGRSIWKIGLYEFAAAEVLWRLGQRDMLAVDVGANIGALTGLLARRCGQVWAIEPHPDIAARLRRNVAHFCDLPNFAPCRVFELALSDHEGEAYLGLPGDFPHNHGIARLASENTGLATLPSARRAWITCFNNNLSVC